VSTSDPVCDYVALPRVWSMSRSHTVTAGSDMRLECHVWGWPIPTVNWLKVGPNGAAEPLNFTADERLNTTSGVALAPRGHAVDNATLLMTQVGYDDRDVYMCEVSSVVNGVLHSHNSTVFIRVKGNYQ